MSDACSGCGDCCRHVGTPPAMWPAFSSPTHDGKWLTESEDWETWQAMPAAVRDGLIAYYRAALDERSIPDRSATDQPCLWLTDDGRCRHYEYRPIVCREEVMPGDDSCLAFRQTFGRTPLPTI